MKLRPPKVFLALRIALLFGRPTTPELRDEKSAFSPLNLNVVCHEKQRERSV